MIEIFSKKDFFHIFLINTVNVTRFIEKSPFTTTKIVDVESKATF